MWCSTCQQDVPGLGLPSGGGELRCGKCGSGLAGAGHRTTQPSEASDQPAQSMKSSIDWRAVEQLLRGTSPGDDDWALQAELRGVQRLLGAMKPPVASPGDAVAVHAAHREPASWHTSPSQLPSHNSVASRQAELPQPRNHSAAWMILSLGLATFVCGVVLLGWSLVAHRDDLWPLGMPLALIGQAGLILGLVLQLDGVWRSSRSTATALSELDGELKHMRQHTTLLTASHPGGTSSVGMHSGNGTMAQPLPANLQAQMDLLLRQSHR